LHNPFKVCLLSSLILGQGKKKKRKVWSTQKKGRGRKEKKKGSCAYVEGFSCEGASSLQQQLQWELSKCNTGIAPRHGDLNAHVFGCFYTALLGECLSTACC